MSDRDPVWKARIWRAIIILSVLFWGIVARCAFSPAEASTPPMPLRETSGGSVADFAERIQRYDGSRRELRGVCASACIMWLQRGCVITSGPSATWLLFHGPSWGGAPMASADFDHWSREIARHYPPAMAAWFMETGRIGYHQMSAQKAIELGAEECEG